jgi:glucose-6-phosphate isomerase
MELPDELLEYRYQHLLAPAAGGPFTPLAEMQAAHFLSPARLREVVPQLMQVRGQVAADREMQNPPPESRPVDAGFINLPQDLLDNYRRKKDHSEVGRILRLAARLRENADRVIVLASGNCARGARALVAALSHSHHNEMPAGSRMSRPRLHYIGENFDNDAVAELLELLEVHCVDPELAAERWGVIVADAGDALETAATFRLFLNEASRYYGHSDRLRQLIVPVARPDGRLRELARAVGIADEDVASVPPNVGGRFSPLTAAGLLPAAVMGLDVRALLLGAAAMTKRFLEEPFDRNPVMQFAAVNHLMATERGKSTRVLAVWSGKLEALGHWYDQLVAESLGKAGRGPTPITAVMTRDLSTRGQQLQEGHRDKLVNHLVVRSPRSQPLAIGMADRNEDDLNQFSRRTLPELLQSARQVMVQGHAEAARPSAEIAVPQLSEHAIGQLMQMLMLATVVEGRLAGVNPYGEPAVAGFRAGLHGLLKSTPNVPAGVNGSAGETAPRLIDWT